MIMLRELLAERGLTIAEFVRQSGIPRRTIEEILRRRDCRISTARQICDQLNCSLDDFYISDNEEEKTE